MALPSKPNDPLPFADLLADEGEPPVSGTHQRSLPSDRAQDPLEKMRLLVTLAVRRVTSTRDHEFEDIVQASLASVLMALGPRGLEAGVSAPWILCVARNVAIDRLRARRRERLVFEGGEQVRHLVPSGSALEPEHLTHVRSELRRFDLSLRRLGAGQSMVIYQHDVLGHGLAEIAAANGISVAAAQSRLVRGRRAMQRELEPGKKPRGSPTGKS